MARRRPEDWEGTLLELEAKGNDTLWALRVRTQTECPLASDGFMSKTETFLGRRIRPLPAGRQQGWHKTKSMTSDQ
jgi:hypothetical protein